MDSIRKIIPKKSPNKNQKHPNIFSRMHIYAQKCIQEKGLPTQQAKIPERPKFAFAYQH